jgi:MFS superfamily sulfate permease-like transporter
VIWFLGIAVLILVHGAILLSHLFEWHALAGPWPHVVVVVAALLSIAAKTLSEGFALTREIERYEEYRAAVSGLHLAFHSTNLPEEKIRLMVEMEKTAFAEMRAFLRSNNETNNA